MSKRSSTDPAAKPWVPLRDVERPLDQTNGVVDFDVPDGHDTGNAARDLLEKGVVANVMPVSEGSERRHPEAWSVRSPGRSPPMSR